MDPEAFNVAAASIPTLSERDIKNIAARAFPPSRVPALKFHARYRLGGSRRWRSLDILSEINQAFCDYVMERLSREAISSRALSIQIRESTTIKGATHPKTLRLHRYARRKRERDKPHRQSRHEGRPEMATLIDALLFAYVQLTDIKAGLSRTKENVEDGPCVRFVCEMTSAYTRKLPASLTQIDPGLCESLQLTYSAAFQRIKRSHLYRTIVEASRAPERQNVKASGN